MMNTHEFQSLRVFNMIFIILKWLKPKKPLVALNGDGCDALSIMYHVPSKDNNC